MEHFRSLSLAFNGSVAALAYAERFKFEVWGLYVQLLNADGTRKGKRISLGVNDPDTYGPRIRVTNNGDNFAVCWTYMSPVSSQVTCVGITPDGEKDTAPFTDGYTYSVAPHPEGWAVTYELDQKLYALKVNPFEGLYEDEILISDGFQTNAQIVRQADGFALITTDNFEVRYLDFDFNEVGSPVSLGTSADFQDAAAVGDSAGMVWESGGDVTLAIVRAGETKKVPAGEIATGRAAIASAESSFAVLWSGYYGEVGYRAFDLDAIPLGLAVSVSEANTDIGAPPAIVATTDGFLIAALEGVSGEELQITRLRCSP